MKKKKKRANKYDKKLKIAGTLDEVLAVFVSSPAPDKKRDDKKPTKPKEPKPKN